MERFLIRRNRDGTTVPQLISENITEDNDEFEDDVIRVYTDGACIDNGKEYARAGMGIWFGENDPRNVSSGYEGKQTNNVAELLAIIKALTILDTEIKNGEKIIIYSDSRYAIRCCGEYGEKCYKKHWRGNKGKEIPNLELVQTAYMYCKNYNNVKFKHVMAHTGKQDRDSIGNDHADRLANSAAGITKKRTNHSKRIYLNVPYEEKDEAKQMGARWESSKKKWYIMENNRHKSQMMGRWGTEY